MLNSIATCKIFKIRRVSVSGTRCIVVTSVYFSYSSEIDMLLQVTVIILTMKKVYKTFKPYLLLNLE